MRAKSGRSDAVAPPFRTATPGFRAATTIVPQDRHLIQARAPLRAPGAAPPSTCCRPHNHDGRAGADAKSLLPQVRERASAQTLKKTLATDETQESFKARSSLQNVRQVRRP